MKNNGNENNDLHNNGYEDNFDIYENDTNTIDESNSDLQTNISDYDINENEIDIDENQVPNSEYQDNYDSNYGKRSSNRQGNNNSVKNSHGFNHNNHNQKHNNSFDKHQTKRNSKPDDKKSFNNNKNNNTQDVDSKDINAKTKYFGLRVFLFFLISIMWLECIGKSAAKVSLNDGFLTTTLCTIPLALLLTLFCSFSKKPTVNHITAIVIQLIITIWYVYQIIFYDICGFRFLFSYISNDNSPIQIPNTLMLNSITSIILFLFLALIPLVFLMAFGKHTLKFKKTNIAIKSLTALLLVVIYISSLGIINNDKIANDFYNSNNSETALTQGNTIYEEYGLFTLQRIDLARAIFIVNSQQSQQYSTQDELANNN